MILYLKILEENEDNWINPSILAFAGSRSDDGMDYMSIVQTIEVSNLMQESKIYEFTGMLNDEEDLLIFITIGF